MEAGCRLDLVPVGRQAVGALRPRRCSPAEGQPREIRSLKVPDTGITVVYQHHHESGRIDLLYVGP